jgi:hypothetical protein
VILDFPDTVVRLPLDDPDLAVKEYAAIADRLRGGTGSYADLQAAATEAVDTALRAGALLFAIVTPPDADPAVLTGVPLSRADRGADWDPEAVRDSVENVGGPDVRETLVVDTALGPAVIAQRIPGVEQARARRPLAFQLQAFIPAEVDLLLTLASTSPRGWDAHQWLFCQVVRSARSEPRPADEESYENHTYRL